MTTSEDSGQIELDGDVIRYTSTTYSDWTIAINDIRIIGEATNQNGPFADDYFLCFATGPKRWYEASFYASGGEAVLIELGARLDTVLQLRLSSSTDFTSRILWPVEFAGKPMFEYQEVPRSISGEGPLGSNEQTYSGHALDVLGKDR